jgi:hypothetical protein
MSEPDWADSQAEELWIVNHPSKVQFQVLIDAIAAALREEREQCAKTAEDHECVSVRALGSNLPCHCSSSIADAIRQGKKAPPIFSRDELIARARAFIVDTYGPVRESKDEDGWYERLGLLVSFAHDMTELNRGESDV